MEGYIGEIRGFGAGWAPRNWSTCSGQLLAISSNTALFSIIGCEYGGDCRTTFALPDLRGRAPIGQGQGPGLTNRIMAQRSGQEYVTLTQLEMPMHTHSAVFTPTGGGGPTTVTLNASVDLGDVSTPASGAHLSQAKAGAFPANMYQTTTPSATVPLGGVTVSGGGGGGGTVTNMNAGGSQSHNNMQPFLVINWIICLFGIFPSRN